MWDVMIEFPVHPIDLRDVYEILLASLSEKEILEFAEHLASFYKPVERSMDEFEFVMER
jgi:hypothetical protein